ncbi:hypothetical protein B0O99DRAFT_516858 [Bisporella sp. PMI_857]|nr:hypothetical protein B0O99DRAFT_516858 [Bisporella sp. PMI_857]
MDRPLDPVQRTRLAKSTVRAVTPESPDREEGYNGGFGSIRSGPYDAPSTSTSPRSTAGDKPRDKRNGLVFQDSYNTESIETNRTGPPVSFAGSGSFHSRARTRTLDEPSRQRSTSTSMSKGRHRIGSVHSASSPPFHEAEPRPDASISTGYPSITTRASPQLQKSNSVKGGRRLLKKSSRPTSPLPVKNDVPSIDSLPFPIATGDASKIILLMKNLSGRMRGEVEYQLGSEIGWNKGICYIDDIKGSFMYEGDDRGPFHLTVISDLRGCRVRLMTSRERQCKYLDVSNYQLGIELRLLPAVEAEFDLWLAAFLCWQQLRSGPLQSSSPKPNLVGERRPSVQSIQNGKTRDASFKAKDGPSKESNIIKVAKIQLWDTGLPTSPAAIMRHSSSRNLRASSTRSWRRVSCILQDNGEFKLLTENDVTLLSVIQLSQLSRSAIQRLDRSVLDEEFCIAILPQYTSTSTQLSIFRPVYIALESRILFEVWFCLLRSFSIPEIYGPHSPNDLEHDEYSEPRTNDMFRIEKTLTLRVVEAKIRKPMVASESSSLGKHSAKSENDPSIGDYLAEVILDGEIRARTKTKTETRNPFWREDCEFQDLPAYLPQLSIMLKRIQHAEVSTHGFLSSSSVHIPENPREVIYGTVDIPLDKLERGKDQEMWYPILDDQQQKIGEMFLKLRHDELVVLLARDYQEVSELLHRFNTGLTVQIAQTFPTNLRKLAEILTNIFQVSGHAGDWFTALVEDEIDGIAKEIPVHRTRFSRRIGSNESSDREKSVRDMSKSLHGEANLLFRGNSLLTQALDIHMRRLGKEYLEDVLSEKILKINMLNPDCEVDPSRLGQGDDISKNWAQLIALTTEVWDSMSDSAPKCPPEIRQILKYIRAVAEDRYGDFLRTATYTSVSGFLFLRFFCPALLNPKLFGLLGDHPQAKAQRTLTLIAKSLQALANLSTFGQKEAWMEPMNKFLTSNRQTVKDYIDDVCNIPSERQTFTLPASYSTPITILARLPPTSREGFPSLPYLIDHARNFAALVKLWLDASDEYGKSLQLEGDLLKFHELCNGLQKRTNECLFKAETGRSADQLSLQWEEIVEGLENSMIHDRDVYDEDLASVGPRINSPPLFDYATNVTPEQWRPPGSAGSEALSKERRDRQSFWDFGKDKDSRSQKLYDLADPSQASPPSRGPSRNEKRGFLPGFRRKGKEESTPDRKKGFGPGSSAL